MLSLDRQESVKHPELLKEEMVCEFCADLALEPVRCQGRCRAIYCRRCATEWCQQKGGDASCPRKCMKKWQFSLVKHQPIPMKCLYSELCQIPSAEEFQLHLKECRYQPAAELLKHQRRKEFLCDRNHKLQLVERLPRDVEEPACNDCKGTRNLRGWCGSCRQLFCGSCRLPEYTQRGCPIGHRYRVTREEGLRCGVCGLAGSYVKLSSYQDSECRFSICELCYRRLPRASAKELEKCGRGEHTLQRLNKLQKKECFGCRTIQPCWKQCASCDVATCLRCDRAEFQLVKDGMPADIIFQAQACCECGITSSVNFLDREHGLLVCYECIGKPRERLPLLCSEGHLLAYIRNRHLGQCCDECKRMRKCRLVCQRCRPEKKYCGECRSTDLRTNCYVGHPLVLGRAIVLKECFLCREYRQTLDCGECNLSVCIACSKNTAPPAKEQRVEPVRPISANIHRR